MMRVSPPPRNMAHFFDSSTTTGAAGSTTSSKMAYAAAAVTEAKTDEGEEANTHLPVSPRVVVEKLMGFIVRSISPRNERRHHSKKMRHQVSF